MSDTAREQVEGSTTTQLFDRLVVLRNKTAHPDEDGEYPQPQLGEMYLILAELRDRERERWSDTDQAEADNWVADNHAALDRATDVERYR